MAAVVDEPVVAAGPLPELVHDLLHDAGRAGVEGVDGLARLEVDVRVLGGAADERPLGREGPLAVRADQLVGDQRPQVVIGEQLDRVQLVRGAKPVEEVHERHPGPERRGLRDQRHVVRLLHRRRRQQGEAGRRTAITSEWSPKIDSPCAASDRAATCSTAAVSSPATLYMFGIISSRP